LAVVELEVQKQALLLLLLQMALILYFHHLHLLAAALVVFNLIQHLKEMVQLAALVVVQRLMLLQVPLEVRVLQHQDKVMMVAQEQQLQIMVLVAAVVLVLSVEMELDRLVVLVALVQTGNPLELFMLVAEVLVDIMAHLLVRAAQVVVVMVEQAQMVQRPLQTQAVAVGVGLL
jgi:hypothetical protein